MPQIPYTILPSRTSAKGVCKPLIPVILNYKKTHKVTPVAINALIDSGADVCFCADYIGIWLGINLNKNKKEEEYTCANGETFKAKPEIINLHVCGKQFDCKFFFTSTLPKNVPIILGQDGFFDHFKITFDKQNKLIDLS